MSPPSSPKTAVLLLNLGTPDAPTASAVRCYLREFLSDPRVVEIPRLIWWMILNLIILPIRARQSAAKYASIWTPEGSPLKVWTAKQTSLLRGYLGERGYPLVVDYAMRYGQPAISQVLERLTTQGYQRILILPLYPQYSATTTASMIDAVYAWLKQQRNLPEIRFVKSYCDHPAYIEALARNVRERLEKKGQSLFAFDSKTKLVLSFHGIPKRNITLGDPYWDECQKTGQLLIQALGLSAEQVLITFQSRFGKAEWLKPYTAATLEQLARAGQHSVVICCPGFPADCLETLEEINVEAQEIFKHAGGCDYTYLGCLNDHPAWITALAMIAEQNLQGWLPTKS